MLLSGLRRESCWPHWWWKGENWWFQTFKVWWKLLRIWIEEIASLLRKSVPTLEDLADDDKFSSFLSQQFSNLFNGYTKAINKRYRRYGSLFNPRFKRRRIISNSYLYNVLAYIHCNPVLHLFTDDYTDWLYSSWHDYEDNPTWICKDLIDEFDSLITFRQWLDEISNRKLEKLSRDLEANE